MKYIGWDPGRMYNKIFTLDQSGKELKVSDVNAICRGYQRKILEEETDDTKNYLDIDIYEGEKHLGRFFVGSLAYSSHRGDLIISSNEIRKYSKEVLKYEKIRMLAYIAYLSYKGSREKDVRCVIGTGSPTEEYFISDNVLEAAKKELINRYKVKFNHRLFNSYEVNISIEDMSFSPEGTSSGVTTQVKLDNNLIPSVNTECLKELGKNYMIINIGSSSLDGVLCIDGKFVGFFGLDIGSSTALSQIINDVSDQSGYKPDKVKMDFLLQNTSYIMYEGKEIDIEAIAKARNEDLIMQLKVSLLNELSLKGIDYKNLDSLYVTGGFVESLKKSSYKGLMDMLPIKTVISNDPIFDEAKGYMISAIVNHRKKMASDEKAIGLSADSSSGKKVIMVG